MYEYELINKNTKEKTIVYGYNDNNVFTRNNLNKDEWTIIIKDYID